MARILVVEDNPQNLKLATVILEGAGHSVTPAADAFEAERAIAEALPELIVLDMALPVKDGYAFARELRTRPATGRLPILAVSAFAMAGDSDRARAAGCDDYLTKPIRRTILLDRVRAMLDRPPPAAASGRRPPGAGGRSDGPVAPVPESSATEDPA